MEENQKRGYLLENFRLFHLRSPGGATTELHYHEFCKVLLLVSGGGGYFIGTQRYQLRSGDILLIGSRTLHRPELDEHTPYERIIIYISPEYLRRTSTQECELMSVFSGRRGPVLRLGEEARRKIFALAYSLELDLQSQGFGREILGNAGMLQLMVELGRRMESAPALQPSPLTGGSGRIRDVAEYVDAHLTEDLDIDTIAQRFFISRYHLMRLFRQETGITLHQYITRKRLLLARELMDGGMRATQACYQCGFRSYSSFTRASAAQLGTTPTGRSGAAHRDEEME